MRPYLSFPTKILCCKGVIRHNRGDHLSRAGKVSLFNFLSFDQRVFDKTNYVHYIRYLIENEIEMVRRKFCPCVNFAVYFGIGELSLHSKFPR